MTGPAPATSSGAGSPMPVKAPSASTTSVSAQQDVTWLCGRASPCLTETPIVVRQSPCGRGWQPAVPAAECHSWREGQGSMAAPIVTTCLQPQSPRGQQIGRALLQPTFASCRCQRLLLLQNPTVSRTRGLVGGDWQFPDMVVTAECLLLQGPRGQQTGRALQQPSTQPAPPTQTSVAFAIPLSVQTDRHGAPQVQSFRSRAAGRRTGPSLSWLLTGD